MAIPFLIPLLMAAGGAGLGALKGATDGKKGNMLSSALIGGGLGAAGGIAGPAMAGKLGLMGAKAGAMGAKAAGAGAMKAGAAGSSNGLSGALSSYFKSNGVPGMSGEGGIMPASGGSGINYKSLLGDFAGDTLTGMGQQSEQQAMPMMNQVPSLSVSAAPSGLQMMPTYGGQPNYGGY